MAEKKVTVETIKCIEDALITIQTEIIDNAVDVKNVVTEIRRYKKNFELLDNGIMLAMSMIVFIVIVTLLFIRGLQKRINDLENL